MNITKEGKDLYYDYYKTWLKEIEDGKKWKDILYHRFEELTLLKC